MDLTDLSTRLADTILAVRLSEIGITGEHQRKVIDDVAEMLRKRLSKQFGPRDTADLEAAAERITIRGLSILGTRYTLPTRDEWRLSSDYKETARLIERQPSSEDSYYAAYVTSSIGSHLLPLLLDGPTA